MIILALIAVAAMWFVVILFFVTVWQQGRVVREVSKELREYEEKSLLRWS